MTPRPFHPVCGPFAARILSAGAIIAACAAQAAAQAAGQPETTPLSKPEARPDLNFANALLRDNQFARAAEEYERFLNEVKEGPAAADARYGLARARLSQQKWAEARQQYEAFLAMAPSHPNAPTARFRVGETSYMMHDYPAARKALEAFIATNPTSPFLDSAWAHLGDVCYTLRDLPKARLAYEKSLALAPAGRLADRSRFGLGLTLSDQGQFDAALRLFGELVDREVVGYADMAQYRVGEVKGQMGRRQDAIEAFETLERAYPKSPLVSDARLKRADMLGQLGKHDEAEALLRPLLADPAPKVAAQASYFLGLSLVERGRAPEARALLLKLSQDFPDDPWADDALLRAAALALDARDFPAALAQAGSITKRFPTSALRPKAHLVEARAALGLGDAKRAIQLLTTLLNDEKPAPETAQAARYYLGQAYRADGQKEKAAEVFQSLAKTPAALVATDAQFEVGKGHFQTQNWAEAIPALEKYLAGKPHGDVADYALAYLAIARQSLNQHEAAQTALDALAAQFPASKALSPTRLRLADAALAAEQFDRAAALYRAVAEAGDAKWKPRALSGLGRALLQGGKPAEAASTLGDALIARLEADANDPLASADALALARALDQAGKNDDALAAYSRVVERFAKTDQAQAAVLDRARLFVKLGRHEDAARDFGAFMQAPPKQVEGLDLILAEWGWALLDAQKPAESDQAFSRLLKEFPNSARACDSRVNLAESAYQAKNYDEVARLLEPVVAEGSSAKPELVQLALYRLGRIAAARKDWAAAGRWFDRLLTAYANGPFQLEARFWKAEVAFQSNDLKTAEAEFAALAAEPPSPENEGWIHTVWIRRVQVMVLLERWQDALEVADTLRGKTPLPPQMDEIDFSRGRALQGLARFEEARAAYQTVIDARKGSELAARAQLMRGETFFHQRNYSDALREFLKVDLLYDAPAWQAASLLEAGKVYERLAQWAEAAEIYKKLRDKFPKDPSAAEAGRRLEQVQRKSQTPQSGAATPVGGQ